MRVVVGLLLLALLASVLAGCGTVPGQLVPQLNAAFSPRIIMGDFCRMDHPMTYTQRDDLLTQKQIETHNRKWLCTCEGTCATPPPT